MFFKHILPFSGYKKPSSPGQAGRGMKVGACMQRNGAEIRQN